MKKIFFLLIIPVGLYLSCFLSPPSNVTRLYFFENQDHNIAVIDQSKNVLLIPKLQAQKKSLFVHYLYGNGVFIIYRIYTPEISVYLDDSATVSDKQRLEKINSNLIASIAYNELTKEDERIYHELIGHQMTTEEKKLLMLGGGWI